ncbi:hypothetical protein C0992_010826, partial [Termitomyces sp. T32_za158]
MAQMTLMHPMQPLMGKGRYAMPALLVKDRKLLKKIIDVGKEYVAELERVSQIRRPDANPQTAHKAFKKRVLETIRQFSRDLKPKIQRELSALRTDRSKTLNDVSLSEDARRKEAAIIDERIQNLEKLRFAKARDTVATSFYVHGETISKQWINMNKEHTPRDLIAGLRCPSPHENKLERKSRAMANIAKLHHKNRQKDNLPQDADAYETSTRETLSFLGKKITRTQSREIGELVNKDEVVEAMREMKNGRAAGLDGIVLELWIELANSYEVAKSEEKE